MGPDPAGEAAPVTQPIEKRELGKAVALQNVFEVEFDVRWPGCAEESRKRRSVRPFVTMPKAPTHCDSRTPAPWPAGLCAAWYAVVCRGRSSVLRCVPRSRLRLPQNEGEVECQVVYDDARRLQPEIEAEHLGVGKQRHNPAITGERCTVWVFFAQGLAPTPNDVPEALSITPYPTDLVGEASAFWKAEVGRLLAGYIFVCDLVEQIVRDQATFGAYRHVAHQALPPGSRT